MTPYGDMKSGSLGTKLIVWTNVDLQSVQSNYNDIHLRAISQMRPQPSIIEFAWKLIV